MDPGQYLKDESVFVLSVLLVMWECIRVKDFYRKIHLKDQFSDLDFKLEVLKETFFRVFFLLYYFLKKLGRGFF